MKNLIFAASILAAVATVSGPASAAGLDCPTSAVARSAGVSAQEMTDLGQRLGNTDSGNTVPELQAELRQSHPKIKKGDVVDILVSAYCQDLASKGYDTAAAKRKLRQFSRLAYDSLSK